MEKNFKFIDLFAGIGGFHLAMHRLGGECVFASEIDDFARLTYEANFKETSPELFENNLFVLHSYLSGKMDNIQVLIYLKGLSLFLDIDFNKTLNLK